VVWEFSKERAMLELSSIGDTSPRFIIKIKEEAPFLVLVEFIASLYSSLVLDICKVIIY